LTGLSFTKPLARASRFVRVGARFVRGWRGSARVPR